MSEGLPFDALGMVLSSELVRRELGLNTSTILIADEHAKTNGFAEGADRLGKEREEFFERTLESFGFEGFDVILASDLTKDHRYAEILSRINGLEAYERLQIADTEFFRTHGKGIKIGWAHNSMRFDERYFDRLYAQQFKDHVTYIYTQAGKALDGTPLPPYMHNSGKQRLLLVADEDIDYKLEQMPKPVRAYFSHLLDLFEKMVYGSVSNPNNTTENTRRRIKDIYNTIFGGVHA